jgi:hypothetical protein
MLYLLLAMLICLLVPWLPVLLLKLEPLAPPPPLTKEEMERLRAQLYGRLSRPSARKPTGQIQKGAATAQPIENAPATRDDTELSHLTLHSYRWVHSFLSLVFIVTMLGMGLAWGFVFHYLGEARARSFPSGTFVFKPSIYGAIFGVPAIFLGIFSTMGIMEILTRILLGRRYTEYSYWAQARLGQVRQQRISRRFFFFAWFLGGLMAIWALLAMNWYVRLTDDAVAIKPLFGLSEHVYPYNRIQQIVLTSHSLVKNQAIPGEGLHLRFEDGQTWSTGQSFRLPETPEERKRLLDLLSRKSGKPVTHAKLIENVPGW